MSERRYKNEDNREVVWCWVKKYPCQPECPMYDHNDYATKSPKLKCKLVLLADRVLKARMLD